MVDGCIRVIYGNDFSEISDSITIAPKRMRSVFPNAIAIEDITKTNTWLTLNEIVRPGVVLCFVCSSSYYKVNSAKARALERLAEISGNVFLQEVTPFCEDIENLYMTWRYVDREILGYQHYYAFAGGHAERCGDRIVPSLDYELNARKIAPYCRLSRCPVRDNRRVVRISYTAEESSHYKLLRNQLFEIKRTPQPIITALADLVNAFESRRNAVLKEAARPSVIITNLDSYANWYRKHSLRSGTYAKPPNVRNVQQVIFAEPPIIYPYRRLFIEAAMDDQSEVIDVIGNAKVDAFLSTRSAMEMRNVRKFCGILKKIQCESI